MEMGFYIVEPGPPLSYDKEGFTVHCLGTLELQVLHFQNFIARRSPAPDYELRYVGPTDLK